MTAQRIGYVDELADKRRGYIAKCARCNWQLAKRRPDDAQSLLRSHFRIAHYIKSTPVYLED